MMISRGQLDRLIAAYFQRTGPGKGKPAASSATEPGAAGTVQLSPHARHFEELKVAIADLPEVRRELVAGLKSAVQEGRYEVDPDAVAEKIMERLLADGAQSEGQ